MIGLYLVCILLIVLLFLLSRRVDKLERMMEAKDEGD